MNHNMSAYVRKEKTAPTMKNRMTTLLLAGIALLAVFSGMQSADASGFLPDQMIVSTVPPNGDVNPYGVAFVPQGFQSGSGPLRPGDILVSNFNNSMNLQGTGTTIVRVQPQGGVSLFFQGNGLQQQGLSTALGILRAGLVIVGNFPSLDGTCATASNGSLLVINGLGQVVQTIADPNL